MYKLFTLLFLFACSTSLAQTYLSEDFEDATVTYTTSIPEFTDGGTDYFLRTDGTDISAGVSFVDSNGSFFAAQDIDGEGATLPVSLTFDDIDISGSSSLVFKINIAEDDDGSNQDWDDNDYLHITYDIDNSGTFQNLLWIRNDGSTFNSAPFIDTDFDGIGDGTEITNIFSQIEVPITGSGNTIDIKIEMSLDSGEEDIAFDNILIEEAPADCSISNLAADFACNGDNADITLTFDAVNTSGSYNVMILDDDLNEFPFTISASGETVTIPGPTTSQDILIEVSDASESTCTIDDTFTLPTCPTPPSPIRINEVHYDNEGTDVEEFVEIFYASSAALSSPADYTIYLVNGSNGESYGSQTLDNLTLTSDTFGQYYVWEPSSIQNGGPDGVALCGPSGLIQFWSYEGTFPGSGTGMCFDGVASTEMDASQAGDNPAGISLQFNPDAEDSDNPGVGPLSTGNVAGSWSLNAATKGARNEINPLPIDLISFSGEYTNNSAKLTWVVTEINNDYFEIYRSTDNGNTWQAIGSVNSTNNNNSVQPTTYTFIDTNPQSGINLYRLKQVDTDGSSSFENKTVSVEVQTTSLQILAMNKQQLQVIFPTDGKATLSVYTMFGELIYNTEFTANRGMQSIPLSNLANGVYVVILSQDTNQQSKKFVVNQ